MRKILASLALAAAALSNVANATSYSGRIGSGMTLYPGDEIVSPNRQYHFIQQGDGNLVLYRNGVAIWATYKNGNRTVMQGDGNVVQYNGSTPVWASYTGSPSYTNSYTLFLTDNGSLQVEVYGPYAPDPRPYHAIIIPDDSTPGGGGNPPCQMRPFTVCVFPGSASQYNSSVSACSQSDAASYASQHGWGFGACH